jgi:membrane protein implicated in regulation of membrane protease activity
MNPRHATAVLLIAFGAFALLVGLIGGGVGIAQTAGGGQIGADFLVGWLACTGVLPLLVAAALLAAGVRMYRSSDHRLEEVRDQQGRAVGRRLPVLSPLWLALFALTTLLGAVILLSGGLDASSPKGMAAAARYGAAAFVLLAALAGWAFRRTKGPPDGEPPVKGEHTPSEEGGSGE